MSSELTAAGPDAAVAVDASPSDEWCVCKQSWTGQTPQSMTAWLKRAENIPGDLGCAMLRIDGAPAAIGLGVAEEGWLGVFDVTTQPGQRRRGHATRLMEGINAWGADAGARASYLQVQGDNEPAMQLYRRLGHREKYRYWYRRLSSQHT